MLNVVTLNTEIGELFGVAFTETGYLLPVMHPSRDSAELAMVDFANGRITAIDAHYTRTDESGNALRPGKRSDAHKWERADMAAIIEAHSEAVRERDAINRYLASLTPEKRALLEE